jgi:tripartite-type tricarboxylate transporter receptor subunit TctC
MEESKRMPTRRWCLPLLACGLAAAATPGWAQGDYPTRPITLVVPYAAGGGNDIMARVAAEKMSPLLGQQIVIENRGGAGGSIATRAVAKAAPDGYTLVLGGTGTLAINPSLYNNVGYDPRKDFEPVGLIGTSALVLVVHPSVPAKDIKELIAYAKANPRKLTYASAGVGSGIHLAAEYFRFQAGIDMIHVPYKGSGPALNDLVGGHVSMYFSSMPPAIALVKDAQDPRARRDRAHAIADLPGAADDCGNRAARLRGGPALRHRRAGRHAEADHHQAQRSAAASGDVCRAEAEARRRRHRAAAVDARGIRN